MYVAMKDEATCVDLSKEYNLLVTGNEGAKVSICNLQDGQKIGELVGHTQGLTGVRIIPKASVCNFYISDPLIITTSYDGQLKLWSGKYLICLAFLRGHRDIIRSLDCTYTRYV